MHFIDKFLNSITMYKLVLYGLLSLAGVSIILSLLKLLPYSPFQFGETFLVLVITCWITNVTISKLLKAPTNSESYFITAVILYCIMAPIASLTDLYITITAGILAMASKYILAIHKRHIFNPAAIAVLILGIIGYGNAIWWVGSLNLLPFVLILGLLVVRKIRRFYLFWTFLFTSVTTIVLFNLKNGLSPTDSLIQSFTSWPLIFFGTIMLTEPLTTPPTQKLRIFYGAIVGILFGSQFTFGPIYSSPELALVIGNIFSFIVSSKQRLMLTFKEKSELAANIFQLTFVPDQKLKFNAGQYLEWTVPHDKADIRGNRRYFTIASAPTEQEIKIGIKYAGEKSSSFKKALLDLKPGNIITATSLTGDFILPKDISQKLVFVAGGIGVTPFRSIIQNLLDTKEKRDIIFFYFCANEKEFAYTNIFEKATRELSMKMVYVLSDKNISPSWKGEAGYFTEEMVKKYVPDFVDRMYYLSGPNAMVDSYKKLLHKIGVKKIITDYFPGF